MFSMFMDMREGPLLQCLLNLVSAGIAKIQDTEADGFYIHRIDPFAV